MPEIRPFKGLRYDPTKVNGSEVIAPPYDIVSAEELNLLQGLSQSEANDRRYNASLLENPKKTPAGYREVLKQIRAWTKAGILIKDRQSSVYIYEQTFRDPVTHNSVPKQLKRRVLLAATQLSKPAEGIIRHHESTMMPHREDRLKLYKSSGHAISPILCSVEDPQRAFLTLLNQGLSEPDFSGVDSSNIVHKLWQITSRSHIKQFQTVLQNMPATVADGHHRTMTALDYLDANNSHDANAASSFALMGLGSDQDESFIILPTHRLLLQDEVPGDAVERLSALFDVERVASIEIAWSQTQQNYAGPVSFVGIGLEESSSTPSVHTLVARDRMAVDETIPSRLNTASRQVDALILTETILKPIFGIDQAALSGAGRVGFTEDIHDAEDAVRTGSAKAAFLVNPATIDQVQSVASTGEVLPQKTTYYYPKLGTGMVFYSLTDKLG